LLSNLLLICLLIIKKNWKHPAKGEYPIVDIRNPERRELTDFETEILMSFPLIQGLSNQYPTQELSKIKIEAKMSIKDVFEVIKSKHCI